MSSARPSLFARSSAEFDRGISFYDAIYGFAVTLLIANLDMPPADAWRDLSSLLQTGILSQLTGFALSFIVIAAFWRVNVRLIKKVSAMDSATTTMNLIAAAFVILIPFTTQGISDPQTSSYALPAVLYAANIALASIAQTAMFEVARRRGLERDPMSAREHTVSLLDALPVPVVFVISIPIALAWGGDAGKITWLALLVVGPLSARLARGALRREAPAREAA